MGTDIGDGGCLAISAAKQHDRLIQEGAGDELTGFQVLRPERCIPGVAKEWHVISPAAPIERLVFRLARTSLLGG